MACSPGFSGSLKAGRPATLFSAALSDVHASCPWYFLSGGLVLAIGRGTYRISFGKPAGSSDGDELETLSAMRHAGRRWRQALSAEPDLARTPAQHE
ncbi:MAG TPA: hypothetical protein VLK29_08660 [Luteimonas sp.]|nr:hypothetical protein [Luteimonas sp.]